MRAGVAKWALPLMGVLMLAVGGCGAKGTQVSGGSGTDPTPSTAGPDGGGGGDGNGSTTTAPDDGGGGTPTTTTPDDEEPGAVEVTESGFSVYVDYDDSERATAGAVLENAGDRDAAYVEVVFSFKDAAGKPVGTESSYVDAVEGGGTGYAAVSSVDLTGKAVKVDVAAVVQDSVFDGRIVPVTVEGVEPEEYGDGSTINGTAANDGDEVLESVSVTCVLRTGGKIVGGATGYLDTMVPGASITWDAYGPVRAQAAECVGTSYS